MKWFDMLRLEEVEIPWWKYYARMANLRLLWMFRKIHLLQTESGRISTWKDFYPLFWRTSYAIKCRQCTELEAALLHSRAEYVSLKGTFDSIMHAVLPKYPA
jgi:hypothetical protein